MPDATKDYNTPLSPQEETEFQSWLMMNNKQNDLQNYDLRGAWKHDAKGSARGHLPDTWKKPNHPTFSQDSIYSSPLVTGGDWRQTGPNSKQNPDGTWDFVASPDNFKTQTPEQLQQYMKDVEPGQQLIMPQQLIQAQPSPLTQALINARRF